MKNKERLISLSDLKINEHNPRRINKDAFAKLCASIKAFPKMMAVRGIVVDEDGIVIGGTQRYRACLALGMKEVPSSWVKQAADFTPEERRRFIIADNAPDGMAGEWDMDLLANEYDLSELIEWGFDEKELINTTIDRPGEMDRVAVSPWDRVGEAGEGVMFSFGAIQKRVSRDLYDRFEKKISANDIEEVLNKLCR